MDIQSVAAVIGGGYAVSFGDGSTGFAPDDMRNVLRQAIEIWVESGNAIIQYPMSPTPEDVISERTRRLALGFDYDFADQRGVHHIGTTADDMSVWDEVSKGAQASINVGEPNATLNIVTNTGPVIVTAMEFQRILIAATAIRQPIRAASFALQAMHPIPADYAADHYWTAS